MKSLWLLGIVLIVGFTSSPVIAKAFLSRENIAAVHQSSLNWLEEIIREQCLKDNNPPPTWGADGTLVCKTSAPNEGDKVCTKSSTGKITCETAIDTPSAGQGKRTCDADLAEDSKNPCCDMKETNCSSSIPTPNDGTNRCEIDRGDRINETRVCTFPDGYTLKCTTESPCENNLVKTCVGDDGTVCVTNSYIESNSANNVHIETCTYADGCKIETQYNSNFEVTVRHRYNCK